jgi:hypothetical protein
VSQPGIEPGTSCTAGEYSMKRAIRTAVFSCHSGSYLCCYSTPPSHDDGGSWLNPVACDVRMEIRPNACRCVRIAHHVGVTTMQGLDQGHLHPQHRASENVASQPGSRRTLYAKSHSNGVLVAIWDLSLCCYNTNDDRPHYSLTCVSAVGNKRYSMTYAFLLCGGPPNTNPLKQNALWS